MVDPPACFPGRRIHLPVYEQPVPPREIYRRRQRYAPALVPDILRRPGRIPYIPFATSICQTVFSISIQLSRQSHPLGVDECHRDSVRSGGGIYDPAGNMEEQDCLAMVVFRRHDRAAHSPDGGEAWSVQGRGSAYIVGRRSVSGLRLLLSGGSQSGRGRVRRLVRGGIRNRGFYVWRRQALKLKPVGGFGTKIKGINHDQEFYACHVSQGSRLSVHSRYRRRDNRGIRGRVGRATVCRFSIHGVHLRPTPRCHRHYRRRWGHLYIDGHPGCATGQEARVRRAA